MDHQAQTYTKVAYEGDDSQVLKIVVENEEAFEEALSQKDVTSTRIVSDELHATVAKGFITRKQKRETVDGLHCAGYEVHGVKVILVEGLDIYLILFHFLADRTKDSQRVALWKDSCCFRYQRRSAAVL